MHPCDVHGISVVPSPVALCRFVPWRLKCGGGGDSGRGWPMGRSASWLLVWNFKKVCFWNNCRLIRKYKNRGVLVCPSPIDFYFYIIRVHYQPQENVIGMIQWTELWAKFCVFYMCIHVDAITEFLLCTDLLACWYHENPWRQILSSPPLYRWEDWGTERFSNLPERVPLVSGQLWRKPGTGLQSLCC